MESAFRHLRHAARLLARSPLYTATAILSLAVGLGANTAIFTTANALLLSPTPGVHEMERLVDIGRTRPGGAGMDTVSFPTYADLRNREGLFAGVYALRLEPQPFSLGGDAGATRVYGQQVSASYFDVLGLQPAAGSFFRSAEEQLGVPLRSAVLTHAFWQSHFDGQAGVVGREIVLNGDRFTVVGVGPSGFEGSTVLAPDLWVPLTSYARGMASDETLRGRFNNHLILGARLEPDGSVGE
ncbi:MAG TPA: ABC transporter permease, partial [Vicinamibacterales bacterium]|nr:ABC transporter permease [Vicinamibacterales bacterium]